MNDILIIGAGPAGISMAVEGITAGIETSKILILEKAHEHSFTIKKFYPDGKLVTANFKGVEPVCTGVLCLTDSSKHETISFLDAVIEQYKLQVHYLETVHSIQKHPSEQLFTVVTDKSTYTAKIVVIAIGILGKPNKPNYTLPATVKNKIFFDVTSAPIENSSVLVVGGGDSAAEYCQFLTEHNNTVSLSYRQNTFSRMNDLNKKSLEELIHQKKITVFMNSTINRIEAPENLIEVVFDQPEIGSKIFDAIVYALGGTTPNNFLKTIGIEFNSNQPQIDEGNETNIPGLFLVGDLSAGLKGGSIISAFNSANTAMRKICTDYLECKL
jgi:thioredoxin reductase (NADPH)